MQENKLSVFVITRFGIGQRSKNFYNQELPYLENLLARSVLRQKEFITKWLVLIDVNTPNFVRERLLKLASKDLLHVHSHNPFFDGALMPDLSVILKDIGVKNGDKVITIRVDADDAISNNYVSSILDVLKAGDLINKYKEISVNAINGIYFYPIRNKLVIVVKKDYSVQALYSIFGKNFHSAYDYSHQTIGKRVLSKGGYSCILDKKEFWIRSMRQHSVTRFGKKFGILEGRFDFLKNIIKLLLSKILKNNTIYKDTVKIFNLKNSFVITESLVIFFKNHEKNLKKDKIIISPMVQKILNSKKINSKFQIKDILLDLYKNEINKDNKDKIKDEFYGM